MRSCILPFLAILLISGATHAQVFSWKTSDSLVVESTDGYAYMLLNMTNITGDSLLLDWKLLKNTFPSTWDITLCDYNTCYIGVPDSGSMAKLGNGQDGLLALTIGVNGDPGIGEMRFYVYDENDPGVGDTATFIMDASTISTGLGETGQVSELSVYPNPATDHVTISGLSNSSATVWLLDMNGKQIFNKSFNVQNNDVIPLKELQQGIYILKVLDNQNHVFYNRLLKH